MSELDTLVHYPFPLANGEVARLWLPKRLTRQDVSRLVTFLQTLVVGEDQVEERQARR